MKKEDMSCIDCAVKNCNKMDKTYPDFCLTTHMDEEVLNEAMECYNEDENRKVTIAAAEVEYENYCKHTRVEEIMDFAKKINAKKIGIATCVGLLKESRILADILRRHGFEVYGVGCKAGTQKKISVGIPECCEGVGVNMCNPILQAKLLNKAKTDLNVVVGLCVGHDSLFYKYSEALTTTAVTKGIATFVSSYQDTSLGITVTIAIALHNIPEGIAIAMPIYFATKSRYKAIKYAFLSGMAEPLGALIAFLCLKPFINDLILGIIFAVVCGIMLYISLAELIPSSQKYGYSKIALISTFLGFCMMPLTHIFTSI